MRINNLCSENRLTGAFEVELVFKPDLGNRKCYQDTATMEPS